VGMTLRKLSDGALRVTGDAPTEHTFSASGIRKCLESGSARVLVVLRTEDGKDDLVYEVTGFEPLMDGDEQAKDACGEPRWNWTGWETRMVQADGDRKGARGGRQ
jgi:hypothetical protein